MRDWFRRALEAVTVLQKAASQGDSGGQRTPRRQEPKSLSKFLSVDVLLQLQLPADTCCSHLQIKHGMRFLTKIPKDLPEQLRQHSVLASDHPA